MHYRERHYPFKKTQGVIIAIAGVDLLKLEDQESLLFLHRGMLNLIQPMVFSIGF